MSKLKSMVIDTIDLIPSQNGKGILIVSGWYSKEKPDENNFKILCGHQKAPFEIKYMNRLDVIKAHPQLDKDGQPGFRLRAILDEPQDGAEIEYMNETVLRLTRQEAKRMLASPLRSNLEVVSSMPGVVSAGGWVYSTSDAPIEFRVFDSKGREAKRADVMRRPREDVSSAFLAEDERIEGFLVNVLEASDSNYVIEISQGDNTMRIPVHKGHTHKYGNIWPITPKRIMKGFDYMRRRGLAALVRRVFAQEAILDPYLQSVPLRMYNEWFLMQRVTDRELQKQKKHVFEKNPKISLIVAAYNTPIPFFQEMLDSVYNQSYGNWQLCIADGSTNDTLEQYMKSVTDPRVSYTRLNENRGISENMNAAAKLADGDYIALFDHDDFLEPDALYEVVKVINETGAPVIYTDEDKFSEETKKFCDPNLKPDFSPELLLSTNYICHFLAVSKEAWQKAGPLRKEFDGAQDYDFVLRLMDLYGEKGIHHIGRPLYHWRMHAQSTAMNTGSKTWAFDAGKRALEAWMERNKIPGEVRNTNWPGYYETAPDVKGEPLVSILIPNKDHIQDLDKCIKSLEKKLSYRNFEVIIIENNSELPETFTYYKNIEKEYPNVRVIYWKEGFNYSAINNFGAKEAKGDYYLLLNNDTEVISPNLIESMLSYAQKPEVGAVGSKLLYFDDTIQHNGVILGLGGIAGHAFAGEEDSPDNYRKFTGSDVSVVTGACLMVPKDVFWKVGGLNEVLQVAFNDVDFCLKIRQAGYRIVQDSFVKMHHYESKSRGAEDTVEKKKRFSNELREMIRLWGKELHAEDPYYSRNLSLGPNSSLLRSPNEEASILALERYLNHEEDHEDGKEDGLSKYSDAEQGKPKKTRQEGVYEK